MRAFASVRWRIFWICWIGFTVHFATNVVREHYPAFSIVEDGDLLLNEYEGFHADIFVLPNGHAVQGNQVAGSLPAVPVLFLFDPALDALQEWTLERRAAGMAPVDEFRTELPNRRGFFELVRERGLELRFGASTFLTSAFCMAPFSAWLVVLMFGALRERGVAERRAAGLALLFAFGTPVFYRAAHLVHNQFLMIAVFGAFLVTRRRSDDELTVRRLAWGGFLGGTCLALDYAGVVPLLAFWLFELWPRIPRRGLVAAVWSTRAYVFASVPPVLFLWWTQWLQYGHPLWPGQRYQQENAFTGEGYRGVSWPSAEVFWENLVNPSWGLLPFAPLLLLALVPLARLPWASAGARLLEPRDRRHVWVFVGAFMLFCSLNRFSLLQWNTGFRYFLPLVPVLFLLVADRLRDAPRSVRWAVGVPAVAHTWVLSMSRFTQPNGGYDGPPVVLENWREILTTGPQLPWLKTLRQVVPADHFLQSPLWPTLVLALAAGAMAGVWWLGARAERRAR